MIKGNNYLITGGLGLIGSNIVKNIFKNEKNSKCIILDNFTVYIDPIKSAFGDFRKNRFDEVINKSEYRNSKTERVIIERGNAADPRVTIEILRKYKPKIIFHTAAMPLARVNNPIAKEFREGSVDTTVNLLECVDQIQKESSYKLKRFLYISSSMVYGDFKKDEAKESDDLCPKEIYGTMKLAGEIATKGMCKQYSIPYTIVRPSAVYGPTDMNQRVTQYFIEKAINKEKLIVHGKDEKLDFTYIEDLVSGTILAATNPKGANETFNIFEDAPENKRKQADTKVSTSGNSTASTTASMRPWQGTPARFASFCWTTEASRFPTTAGACRSTCIPNMA